MKTSIKIKLFGIMSGLILLLIALTWILNSLFMDKYYLYSKKSTLTETYKYIKSIYKGNPDEIAIQLLILEDNKTLRITILDSKLKVKYFNNQQPGNTQDRVQNRIIPYPGFNLREIFNNRDLNLALQGEVIIRTSRDKRLDTNFISLFASLDNGDYIILTASIAAIQESVAIANKFFLFTGLLTILAASVIIFFVSIKFTKPILELNNITKNMSKLDFSRRYKAGSHDEIGQLGSSINSLSEQLEKSIQELTEANEKLKRDIEKEREIDEMRKYFITSVSHELKTPIALIQGYAEGLKLNVNEDEENKNLYCDIIADEALKMNKLVKQLLDLSQIESGIVNPEKTDFIASELAEHVLKKNSVVFSEKSIRIKENYEQIMVNADFDRCEQVLCNYINNAVNHIDENKLISITIRKNGNKARMEVFNTGSHIPAESIDKIWSSFYKVDKARTRNYGGFGLGLSIVRAIQESQQNGYGVENVEGGVVFWFEMDISDNMEQN